VVLVVSTAKVRCSGKSMRAKRKAQRRNRQCVKVGRRVEPPRWNRAARGTQGRQRTRAHGMSQRMRRRNNVKNVNARASPQSDSTSH